MDNKTPLSENFQRYFDVNLAQSQEQKEKVYNIRYRVYCAELQYEDPDRFPNNLETDEFDGRSLHCLLTHKATGLPAGCVRMVSTRHNGENFLLPMEKYCLQSIDRRFHKIMLDSRDEACEISRLAVDSTFRRRTGEGRTLLGRAGATDISHQEERAFSLVAIAGALSGIALAEYSGRNNIFAMMEPYLPRLLRRSGLHFKRAGKVVDYHGHRAPYLIQVESIHEKMHPELKALYHSILKMIENGIRPSESAVG